MKLHHKLASLLIAGSAILSTPVIADDVYIDTAAFPGGSKYDLGTFTVNTPAGPITLVAGNGDSNTQTAVFSEFGFSQNLATSIYDFSNGSIFGSFVDTNIPSELVAAGIPAAGLTGLALDGTTTVDIKHPIEDAQTDIDALSPIAPPLGGDNEGYLSTWYLDTEFKLNGVLSQSGPVYTGGYIEFYLVEGRVPTAQRTLALRAEVEDSMMVGAGLVINFETVSALPGMFFVDDGLGNMVDLSTMKRRVRLDTNVDPAIPTASELLLINGGTSVVRQSALDGSVQITVPEPASLAILSLGILGLAATGRKKR